MPTGFTYSSYQAAVTTQIPTIASDPNFQTILPTAIDYAELSIYRDLDFLTMHTFNNMGLTTVGQNTVPVPSSYVVLEGLYLASTGLPLLPVSQDYLRSAYAGSPHGVPESFAVTGAATSSLGNAWSPAVQVLLGPTPDMIYVLQAYASIRQQPLSATTTTTFISLNLPDLFWAASMIFFSGYNRNFGAQSDDPRQALSWESEYRRILEGSSKEEIRKKFLSQEATAKMPQMRVQAQPQGAPQ